jgi:hypothetical protein
MNQAPGGFAVDAMLCDSAVTAEGKLYVQGGGWNQLSTPQFPFVHPRIGVAITLWVPYTETNRQHQMELALEHEDGPRVPLGPPRPKAGAPGEFEQAMSVKAQFNLGRPPQIQPGDAQVLPIAMNFDQLAFTAPGAYSFVMTVDDEELHRLAFRVVGLRSFTITPPPG